MDCHHKRIRFDYLRETPFYIQGDHIMALSSMILAKTISHLMRHGCLGFLVVAIDTQVEAVSVAMYLS